MAMSNLFVVRVYVTKAKVAARIGSEEAKAELK